VWKALRSTNVIERLHEEFRRRVKTQGSLPSEDAALVLLFSLVASGQIKLRKIDGWRKIAAVLNPHRPEEHVLFARTWKPRLVGVGG
jgi:transposase-like protein